jgi:transcriptional regulator with XRE-family HTH domain
MNYFAERFKIARKHLGLTQSEIAKDLNFDQKNISHWESGRNKPSSDALAAFCEKYNINSGWLLCGAGEMIASKFPFTHKDLIDITVSEEALATGIEKDIISGEVSCGTFSSVSLDESSGKIIIHPRIARKIDKFWKVKGNSMVKFGFTSGMLVGIKFTKEISHNDIVLMAMYEIDSPPQLVLKQAKQIKSGGFIFQNGDGEPIELSENVEVLGKYIYKMDDPMNL